MNRRTLLTGTAATLASLAAPAVLAHSREDYDAMIKPSDLPPEYMPRMVDLDRGLAAREIHVFPEEFALYWTLGNGKAMRYTVGIGRPGLYEAGEFYIGAKKAWPSWTPTPGMIRREPEKYARYKDGMPGGPKNPLGARALYLFTPERGDTFLRIHGTDEPDTLAQRVSNGCARLVNDQIVDFYMQVPLETRVVLYPVV